MTYFVQRFIEIAPGKSQLDTHGFNTLEDARDYAQSRWTRLESSNRVIELDGNDIHILEEYECQPIDI